MVHENPDLNPCDFFLWGYHKDRVYRDPVPQTLEQLKCNITRDTRRVGAALVENVMKDFTDPCQKGGSHERQMVRALANMI